MKDFNGKVAAITGAGSGIGQALAIELAQNNCDLALSDINMEGLAETEAKVSALGVKVTTAKVDVAIREEMHTWADQVVADHGKVNMIFNNAGVALSGTVEHLDYHDYEWILGINLWGVIYGTKAFIPYLKQAGEGHIINISSVFGLFAQPTQSGYNMSKFAVRGFTECLRQELDMDDSGVSATCVHPGGIKTNIARDARMHSSLSDVVGGEAQAEKMRDKFEGMFLTTSEQASSAILDAVRKNKRRILVGPDAKAFDVMQRILPVKYQKIVTSSFKYAHR